MKRFYIEVFLYIFRNRYGMRGGMFISSIIFTVVHIPTYNTLPVNFLSGVVFAWLYERNKFYFIGYDCPRIIQFHSSTSHIYVELRRYIGGIHMEIAVERIFYERDFKKSSEFVSCNSGRKAAWRF